MGEQRSVVLADGSRVTLNTASKIEVRLQADHRVVELLQGERCSRSRMTRGVLSTCTQATSQRAVGTQFDIDRRATRTAVTVVEGRVAVIAAGSRTGELPVLSAGDRVIVGSDGSAL